VAVTALVALTVWVRHRTARSTHEVLESISRERMASHTVADAETSVEMAWTAPGLRRFHRRSCAALASATGEPVRMSRLIGDAEPCLLCHPEA